MAKAKRKQAGPTVAARPALGSAGTNKEGQPRAASNTKPKARPAPKKAAPGKSGGPRSGKTWSDRREGIARRLREIRGEKFGERGGLEAARRLGLPVRTWYNYETGVTVPAEVLLAFIELTGVNPEYLLTGKGPKYPHPQGHEG
ncbi:helix-turn-helix domain-containing protein [Aquisphaera insulae]|uniref:helix-turn-helix domain-containing protein n=1 Tax=Aquisphaera insulae TaxID=2712864 RepID=UPI00202ECB7B|nr:helix-turn-helix transcriptional regulator [Aquisphaera insulae]